MRKYNRGVSIVEILLSIIIIGLILIVLFNMLINVRNEDQNNQIQSQFVLNQAQFVEKIEEDFVNYGISSVSSCDVMSVDMQGYNINEKYRNNFKCLRFDYSAPYLTDNIGYLMVYNYNFRYDVNHKELEGKEDTWMIRYIRGHFDAGGEWQTLNSLMNEIPGEAILDDKPYVNYNRSIANSTYSDAAAIVLPIANAEGEHYDIYLSYMMNSTSGFTCYTGQNSSASYAPVICNCVGDEAKCNASKNNGMKR